MTPDDDPVDEHRRPGRVRRVYDEIASHFSRTRATPWPEVEEFLSGCERGEVGLDLGCGNGRHTVLLADRVERPLGIDLSRGLLREARPATGDRDPAWLQGDARRVPVAAGVVDVAIYIATLHHLPDRERRLGSLAELARVLGPGGRGLVSVWSTTHDSFDRSGEAESGFDTTVDWTLPGGETVPRYYHIYSPAEFERDLAASPLAVAESFVSSGNCYAVVRG